MESLNIVTIKSDVSVNASMTRRVQIWPIIVHQLLLPSLSELDHDIYISIS